MLAALPVAMTRLCQAALLLSLSSTGCYLSHGRPGPTAQADGGVPAADASARTDSFLVPDPPPRCASVRADATCLDSFAFVAGAPFEIPFQFDGCACCGLTECEVAVDTSAHHVDLETHLCPDRCNCDTCNTPRGSCRVPAIPIEARGEWTVTVNGTDAFVIGVFDPMDPMSVQAPGCATYAEADDCGGAVPDFTMGPLRASCTDHLVRPDREALVLRSFCWECGALDSACDTHVEPRLTDDLPPGADIVLHARSYAGACDVDCPAICIEHVRECALPPLTPGDFYRVIVDGDVVTSFTGGREEPTLCLMP